MGPPLAQSSPNRHRPSLSTASVGESSTSSLRRSLTRQQEKDKRELEAQPDGHPSRPPTLRHLLGPLQAQLAATRRPQTPRTAHRTVVAKLRNEYIEPDETSEDSEVRPNRDLDEGCRSRGSSSHAGSLTPRAIRDGLSMLTLDGIGDDDPFVSMETRRAMESQLYTTAPRDFLPRPRSRSQHQPEDDDELDDIGDHRHAWSTSSSVFEPQTPTELSLSSWRQEEDGPEADGPEPLPSPARSSSQNSLLTKRTSTFPPRTLAHPIPLSPVRSYSDFEPMGTAHPHPRAPDSPSLIPLPPSPNLTSASRVPKILLASQGARLELVRSDVPAFEKALASAGLTPSGWAWVPGSEMVAQSKQGSGGGGVEALLERKRDLLSRLKALKTSESGKGEERPDQEREWSDEPVRIRVGRRAQAKDLQVSERGIRLGRVGLTRVVYDFDDVREEEEMEEEGF